MKLGYQLYSSRNFGPLDQTLRMLAALGYGHVEGYGGLFETAEDRAPLSEALAASGLTMPSAHIGLEMVEDDPGAVIALARDLDISRLFVPWLAPEDRPEDASGWHALGARLDRLAEPLEAAGIMLGWHNHDFEFTMAADGSYPILSLLEGAPDLGFEFDLAWAVRAGEDPLAWITRLEGRISAAHVKDLAPAGENADEDGWADVGQGRMDWGALIARLAGAGCPLFVVEHDNPNNDQRFALRSLDFLQTL